MEVNGELLKAAFERLTADPAPLVTTIGRVIFRTDLNTFKVQVDATTWSAIGGGGLTNKPVSFSDSPVTAEIGTNYIVDTTGGPVVINKPEIGSLPATDIPFATIAVTDCKGNFHLNSCFVNAGGADTQNFQDATVDTSTELNQQGIEAVFYSDTPTSWCVMTPNTPGLDEETETASGEGGTNFFENGRFTTALGTSFWSKVGTFSALSLVSGAAALEGENSLSWTNDTAASGNKVSGVLTAVDPIYRGKVLSLTGGIRIVGTGSYTIRLIDSVTLETIAGTELVFTGIAAGVTHDVFAAGVITTENPPTLEIEDTGAGVDGDVITIDLLNLTPDGGGLAKPEDEEYYFSQVDATQRLTFNASVSAYFARLTPYQALNGTFRLKGNVSVRYSAGQTLPNFSIQDTIVSSTETVNNTIHAISAVNGTTNVNAGWVYDKDNGLFPNDFYGSGTSNAAWSFEFDIPIDTLPSWATRTNLSSRIADLSHVLQNSSLYMTITSTSVPFSGTTPVNTSLVRSPRGIHWNETTKQATILANGDYRIVAGISSSFGSGTTFTRVRWQKSGTDLLNVSHFQNTGTPSGYREVPLLAGDVLDLVADANGSTASSIGFAGATDYASITRVPDSTGLQQTGAGTSEILDSIPRPVTIIGEKHNIDFAGNGDFDGGKAVLLRYGNKVSLHLTEAISVSPSISLPQTSTAVVPEHLRPISSVRTIFVAVTSVDIRVFVLNSNGQVTIQGFNFSGALVAINGSAGVLCSVDWAI